MEPLAVISRGILPCFDFLSASPRLLAVTEQFNRGLVRVTTQISPFCSGSDDSGFIVGKREVIVGGAFVRRFCARRTSAKLHLDAHAKLIANSPKWENYEEKSRRVSGITSNETQTSNLQVKNYR